MPEFDVDPAATRRLDTPGSHAFAEPASRDPVHELDPSGGNDDDLEDDDDEYLEGADVEPALPAREGLPPSFRMRHAPHYVEQLMAEGPLQTVRRIPVSHVHGPHVGGARVSHLAESIKEIGLLEPLLVTPRGGDDYDVLAGGHRLAAAREALLDTVPCLIVEADEAMAAKFREAAGRDAEPAAEPLAEEPAAAAATTEPAVAEPPTPAGAPEALLSAFAEISEALAFVNTLMPLTSASPRAFRSRVAADLVRIETERATVLAAAAALLVRPGVVRCEELDCAAHVEALRAIVSLEARYKGVEIEWHDGLGRGPKRADRLALQTSWSALLHALLAIAAPGERLIVTLHAPRVRPALILDVVLRGASPYTEDPERLLDASWKEHPGGLASAVMLGAAARSAQLHRGRLTLHAADGGLSASFVIPQ